MSFRVLVIFIIVAIALGAVLIYWQDNRTANGSPPTERGTLIDSGRTPDSKPGITKTSVQNPLLIGFSFSKPPYVAPGQFADIDPYADQHAPLGLEVDIMHAALAATGYTYKPSFQSFSRVILGLHDGSLDAAETSGSPRTGIYYSRPIICCQNYAISRKSARHYIDSIGDLSSLRCVAWQGAAKDLGPAFMAMTEKNPSYYENTNQQAQYQMFADGKVDVIIIDKFIFQWWRSQDTKVTAKDELFYHPIFPGVNPYYIGFRDKAIRDAFDEQFVRLQESGEIDRIIRSYIPDHPAAASGSTRAIPVAYGIARPPFVLEQERRGLSVDLAEECFRRMGILTRPTFYSNLRMISELTSGTCEIGVEMKTGTADLHYSAPFTTYYDIIASRSSEHRKFHAWNDLKGLRVGVWQTARTALGNDFDAAVPTFEQYTEFSDQREQVLSWINGKCDVIVIEKTMLMWHLSALAKTNQNVISPSAMQTDDIPGASPFYYYVGFRSEALRNSFDQVLKEIHQDGTYERILARYFPEKSKP